jgi:hypothetical protein
MSKTMLSFLDAYTIRARLFPAILAVLPALAALALLITWTSFSLTNILATLAILVIMFVLADFARRQGKRIEPKIYAEMGGKPSVTMMRYSDNHVDALAKDRYRAFLARKINRPAPTEEDERERSAEADAFYEQAGTWLRENTRDTKRFSILFNENVTYGFRRNLLGMKRPALILNGIVVALCLFLIWWRWPTTLEDDLTKRILLVLAIAAIHALYVAFVVSKSALKDASQTYARQLILSCEVFMTGTTAQSAPRARKRSAD